MPMHADDGRSCRPASGPDHRERGSPPSQGGLPGDESYPDGPLPCRDGRQEGCGVPEATPGTGVVRTPWHAQSAEGRPLSGHGTGGCTAAPRGGPSGAALHGHAVPLQGRPSAMAQGSVAAPRPPQASRRHDDGAHAAAQAAWGEGAPAVAERPRALRGPYQAAGKDTRGEKHTGGRKCSRAPHRGYGVAPEAPSW